MNGSMIIDNLSLKSKGSTIVKLFEIVCNTALSLILIPVNSFIIISIISAKWQWDNPINLIIPSVFNGIFYFILIFVYPY